MPPLQLWIRPGPASTTSLARGITNRRSSEMSGDQRSQVQAPRCLSPDLTSVDRLAT